MDDKTWRLMAARLDKLERESVRYRQGVVSSITPLSVTLGGSTVALASVKNVSGQLLAVSDVVAVIAWGNDMLILGKVSDNTTSRVLQVATAGARKVDTGAGVNPTFSASATSSLVVVPHALAVAPTSVVCTFGQIPVVGAFTPVVTARLAATFSVQVFSGAGAITSSACLLDWAAFV